MFAISQATQMFAKRIIVTLLAQNNVCGPGT